MMTNLELLLTIENDILLTYDKEKKFTLNEVIDILDKAKSRIPYDKVVMIEDGSVDTCALEDDLNLGKLGNTKFIVYRQGSQKPEYLEVQKDEH